MGIAARRSIQERFNAMSQSELLEDALLEVATSKRTSRDYAIA
jgi:hypothetical protein